MERNYINRNEYDADRQRGSRHQFVRIVLVVLILSMVLMSFTSCKEEDPIKIGVIISQSGAGGHLSAALDAIKLAAEEINESGGIQQRLIEVYSTDNETDPELAVKQFQEMEKDIAPDIYITGLSSISTQLIPLAEAAEVPILCIVTAMEDLTKSKEWAFRFYSMASNEVAPIMDSLREYNIKDLGIVHSDDEYGMSVFNLLSAACEEEGISVADESFKNGATDLSEQVGNLADKEGIYVIGLVSAMPVAVDAFTETGYQGYRLATSAACSPGLLSLPAAEGMIVAAPVIYNKNFSLAETLNEKYMQAYGAKPTQQVATGYEAIKILAGLLQDGEITRESIKEKLALGFVYTGALGSISVKRGEHDFTFPLYPARIEEGVIVYE